MIVRYTNPGEYRERHRAAVQVDLEKAARPFGLRWWEDEPEPTSPCGGCSGTGRAPTDGPPGAYVTCSACRGLGRRPATDTEIRAAYRALRARACGVLATTPEAFDAAAGAALPDDASPARWLLSATKICRGFAMKKEK